MIYVVLALLAIILAWRIVLPSMKLEPRADGGTATTAPVTTPSSGGWFTGYSKNIPTILLVIAGAVVFFVGIYKPTTAVWSNPSPTSVGGWGQNHWLALLILWGIVAALIALNACGATAKTLQWVATGVVVAMLVVFPLWGLATSLAAPAHVTADTAQQPPQRRMLSVPANGYSNHVLPPVGYATTFYGHGYTIHCVYSNGTEGVVGDQARPCKNGEMLYQYVRDTSGQLNSVEYEFVR
jgi:hypothetical protein